jgi:hypothetical protein
LHEAKKPGSPGFFSSRDARKSGDASAISVSLAQAGDPVLGPGAVPSAGFPAVRTKANKFELEPVYRVSDFGAATRLPDV